MRIPVYLEVGKGGATRAWVLVLPGVAAAGPGPAAALAALPAVVAEELARLARLGAPWPHAGEALEFVETERVEVDLDLGSGASTALFRHDLRPTRPEDVAAALARFGLACREIEAAARGAGPSAALDARLAATADGIVWLLTRLGTRPAVAGSGAGPTATPAAAPAAEMSLERFLAAEAAAVERLTNLLPGDVERHAVFLGEPWTTRKVLRRLALLARGEALALTAPAPASTPAP